MKVTDYALTGYSIIATLETGKEVEIPLIEFAEYLDTDMIVVFDDMADPDHEVDYLSELQLFIKHSEDLVFYNDDKYDDPEYDLESNS